MSAFFKFSTTAKNVLEHGISLFSKGMKETVSYMFTEFLVMSAIYSSVTGFTTVATATACNGTACTGVTWASGRSQFVSYILVQARIY